MDRWAVCKNRYPDTDGEIGYELRRLFSYEKCVEAVDPKDGAKVTLIQRDGQTVDCAGELCGEFEDQLPPARCGFCGVRAMQLDGLR